MVFKKRKKEEPDIPLENQTISENLPELETKEQKIEETGVIKENKIDLPEDYEFITAGEFIGLTEKGKPLYRYVVETTQRMEIGLQED